MKIAPFEYHEPRTVDEVVALLAEHGDEAKVLAGGQSLVPLLAMRLARPTQLVDVNRVEGLDAIDDRGDVLALGARVRERAAESSGVVATSAPLLAAALPHIGHAAIRTRGTIGGSLAHADASGELPAVALALGAGLLVRSVGGERVIAADDFFLGHFTTALADDECLVEVRLPRTADGVGTAVEEVARRPGDFAIAGVAATITLAADGTIADSRLALFGVADTAVRARDAETALRGTTPGESSFAEAAELAMAGLDPPADVHGSSAFRRHVAGVAVRRALASASQHAAPAA